MANSAGAQNGNAAVIKQQAAGRCAEGGEEGRNEGEARRNGQ